MPSLFIGHGSPMNAIEDTPTSRAWRALGQRLPRPKAILAVSAHWETKGTLITAAERPRTIHDFYGFPPELFAVEYPAPGDPALAHRIQDLLSPFARADLDGWGLDHGAWSVLVHLFPQADVPVLQLSMDLRRTPQQHYELGGAIAALRDEGVMILGSGNVVHNLRFFSPRAVEPLPWGLAFDAAVREAILAGDHEALTNFQSLPGADLAVAESEHYLPLLYVLGAARPGEKVEVLPGEITSAISMTSVLVGA